MQKISILLSFIGHGGGAQGTRRAGAPAVDGDAHSVEGRLAWRSGGAGNDAISDADAQPTLARMSSPRGQSNRAIPAGCRSPSVTRIGGTTRAEPVRVPVWRSGGDRPAHDRASTGIGRPVLRRRAHGTARRRGLTGSATVIAWRDRPAIAIIRRFDQRCPVLSRGRTGCTPFPGARGRQGGMSTRTGLPLRPAIPLAQLGEPIHVAKTIMAN